jgi:hypothetical protein
LNEASLNESAGIGGNPGLTEGILPVPTGTPPSLGVPTTFSQYVLETGPVDWNGNGNTTDVGVTADVNADGNSTEILVGHNNWPDLVYSFRDGYVYLNGNGQHATSSNVETPETSSILGYTIPPGQGPTDLVLRLDGSILELFNQETQSVVASKPLSGTTMVQVYGADNEHNSLTIDFTFGGFFNVSGGISFSGGAGGDNSARIIGNGQTTGTYTPDTTTPGKGTATVSLGSQSVTIGFAGLQPLEVSNMASFKLVTPNNNDNVTVNSGTASGGQPAEVISGMSGGVAFESLTFFNIPAFTLDTKTNDGPNPNDVINVKVTLAGTTTTILTGAGTDTVNVGSMVPATGGIVDNINGPLVVTSDPGATLNVDDTGSKVAKTGFLTSNTITGLSMAGGITYSGMQDVNVGLGIGNDIFNIQSTSATTTVNGGVTFDVFNVGTLAPASGGYLSQLGGAVFLNGAASGSTTMNIDDQLDPLGETMTLTKTTFISPVSALITYSNVQGIGVNAGSANDTLVVDSTAGLVNVANGINYDGGSGFNTLKLVQTSGTQDTDVYSPGPNAGQGISTITGGGQTQTVYFQHLSPVIDLMPATSLTVNGTPANNSISYGPGNGDPVNNGLVTVDNFESIEFSKKANLFINTGAGTDTVDLENSNTPTGLTSVTVTGGTPPNNFTTLIVNGVGATVNVNTATNTITGATGAGGSVPINFSAIEALTVNAGPSTTLAVAGSSTYVLSPEAATDFGTLQTATLPLSYTGFGTGKSLALTGTETGASLLYYGTQASDLFAINTSPAGGEIDLNTRASVTTASIPTATLEGLGGSDTFTLVPTISASPFTTLNLLGSGPGSIANLTAANATAPLVVSGQVVTQGGKMVAGNNLSNEKLNGALNDLTYNGIQGVTEHINVIASTTANQGQVSVPGVALWSFTNVPIVYVNGQLDDGDTLTFTGTTNNNTWKINLAATGTDADPVLQLQNAAGTSTLLTLGNYTGFSKPSIVGLSGSDIFNVYVAPVGFGRQIYINAEPSTGKKLTNVLNVFYAKPKPSIVHSTSTQNPDSGLVSANYGGNSSFLIDFDGIPKVTIQQQG